MGAELKLRDEIHWSIGLLCVETQRRISFCGLETDTFVSHVVGTHESYIS